MYRSALATLLVLSLPGCLSWSGNLTPLAPTRAAPPSDRLALLTYSVTYVENGKQRDPEDLASVVRRVLASSSLATRVVRSDLSPSTLERNSAHIEAQFERDSSDPWRPLVWLSIATLTAIPTWSIDHTRLKLAVTRPTGPTTVYLREERVGFVLWLPLLPLSYSAFAASGRGDENLLLSAILKARSDGVLP